MNILDGLFRFPIVMVDGDNEDRKGRLGTDESLDIIIGEAECHFQDFISITDRWLPNDISFNRALDEKFDACFVVFGQAGSFVVPWNKDKFKDRIRKFIEEQPTHNTLGRKQLMALAQHIPENEQE